MIQGDGNTPLITACKREEVEIVQLFLKHSADVHAQLEVGAAARR